MTTTAISDLLAAGLLDAAPEHHLTAKGREWLRALESLQTEEITAAGESDEDFVLSTSGLFR